jgi:hypothetical protein
MGTLARLGPDPAIRPAHYARIVSLFASTDPIDRRRVRVLGQIPGKLSTEQILAVSHLDPVLVHRAVVQSIPSPEAARNLNRAVAYLRRHCSAFTDDALRQSLDRWLGQMEKKRFSAWFRRWVERFDKLPDDSLAECLTDQPDLILLTSGRAMLDAARRFENCLASKIPEVLAGRAIYIEHRPIGRASEGLLAELRWTAHGYLLEGLYGPGHKWGENNATQKQMLRERLRTIGIVVRERIPSDPSEYAALTKALGYYAWSRDAPDLLAADALEGIEE